MPAFDNTYSRVVFWLKITLPLAALAILSTLFLFARSSGPEGLIPMSEVDVEELAREQRLGEAEISGMTGDGAALTIRAAVARPGIGDAAATADDVTAAYERDDGFRAELTALSGRFEKGRSELILQGSVRVVLSNGYIVETEILAASLNETQLTAPGVVAATAPFGQLVAGQMDLRRAGAAGSEVLVFKGGVRLIYDPKE